MTGLCAPLPTLRLRPRERKRTAWGRCGSLLLHRIGLAPITPCRSPGAQSPQLHQDVRTNRRDFLRRRIARTYASAIERSERSQRRIPPCGYRPKPETTRPTKADEYASGNAGRIAPRMAAQAPPKQSFQPVSQTRRAFPIRGIPDGSFGFLLLLWLAFTLLRPQFITPRNLSTIISNAAILAIVAA